MKRQPAFKSVECLRESQSICCYSDLQLLRITTALSKSLGQIFRSCVVNQLWFSLSRIVNQ